MFGVGKFFTCALALNEEPDGFATSRGKLHQRSGQIEHEGHSLPAHERHDTFKNSAHSPRHTFPVTLASCYTSNTLA